METFCPPEDGEFRSGLWLRRLGRNFRSTFARQILTHSYTSLAQASAKGSEMMTVAMA